jgi:hypothetical protein
MKKKTKAFSDYKKEGHNWITLASGEYYPDILQDARELYKPVLVMFGQILKVSESSVQLFMGISEVADGWMRVQLSRCSKYASPETPVEMLKRKHKRKAICEQFGKGFRPIHEVQSNFYPAQCLMRRYALFCGNIKIVVKRLRFD